MNRQGKGILRPSPQRWLLTLVPIGLLCLSSISPAEAAKAVVPRYYIGCDSQTAGDPYVHYSVGHVGGGSWTESFGQGYFNLTHSQYATSSGGGSSTYDVWPWIHFGPGSTNKYGCVVKSTATPTPLSFHFVKIRWAVDLQVNCTEDSTANASYAINMTGDMVDYRTGAWLVSTWHHVNVELGTHWVTCKNGGGALYAPRPFLVWGVTVSTGNKNYTLVANGQYMYFAQPRVFVSAETTGGASATATVSNVTARLLGAHCPGC